MKRFVSVKIYVLTVVILIVCFCVFFLVREKKIEKENVRETISIEYQDNFEEVKILDYEGKTVENFGVGEKPSVIFYLSNTCKTCIEDLDNFSRINEIFGDENINFCILWEKDTSESLLKKNGIDFKKAYVMNPEQKLAAATPTVYITDKHGTVVFNSTEINLSIEKLIDLGYVDREKLIKNANNYLKKEYGAGQKKPLLVYFAMDGCPDCEAATPVVESKTIIDKYQIQIIYKYDDVKNEIKDKDQLFKLIYGIEWYPSFVILDNESYYVIGETPINELEKRLLNPLIENE